MSRSAQPWMQERKSLRTGYTVSELEIPQHVLDERAHQQQLRMERDALQDFFGDPLPGYSALDAQGEAQ